MSVTPTILLLTENCSNIYEDPTKVFLLIFPRETVLICVFVFGKEAEVNCGEIKTKMPQLLKIT